MKICLNVAPICLVCEWERTGEFVNLCKSFRDLNTRGILRVIISQWRLIWFGLKWIMNYGLRFEMI